MNKKEMISNNNAITMVPDGERRGRGRE